MNPSVTRPERSWQILNLSARSASALKVLATHYIRHLDEHITQRLADICFTANVGRTHFPYRLSVVTASREELQRQLRSFVARRPTIGVQSSNIHRKRGLQAAFFIPGDEEALYPGMARALYEAQPMFRQVFDHCADFLQTYWKMPHLSLLFSATDAPALLVCQDWVQPVLFALDYALCQLWLSWGVAPAAVQGCGVGEYVAACIAGVFTLEDGLRLAVARGQWLQQQKDCSIPATETSTGPFVEVAERIDYSVPCLPFVASATGRFWQSAEPPTASYWLRHLQEPVRTAEGLQSLIAQGYQILLEAGPGLAHFSAEHRHALADTTIWLHSLVQGEDDWHRLLTSLSTLYIRGSAINWYSFERDYQHSRIPLPTYPFERKRYWMTDDNEAILSTTQPGGPGEVEPAAHLSSLHQSSCQSGQVTRLSEAASMRRETILATLIEMAERVFHCGEISDTQAPFFTLGADMLSLLALMREIERSFGIQLMLHQLTEEVNTLDALTSYLEQMLVAG